MEHGKRKLPVKRDKCDMQSTEKDRAGQQESHLHKNQGTVLSDTQIKSMLEGKKTLVKGIKGKKSNYDAYLIPEGVEDYSYIKDGKEIKGTQYKVRLEFPKKFPKKA